MKKIAIIIFDDFTDIDLFLMWDIFGRIKDWQVKILGTKEQHRSTHGLQIATQGNISEANAADVVLFTSGRIGVQNVIKDKSFLNTFALNPETQMIGSICSGSLILAALGLIKGPATTHFTVKSALKDFGIEFVDKPFVCHGNVATAGGCLSAQYLTSWIIERFFSTERRKAILKMLAPTGQSDLYERLITSSIEAGMMETI